MTTISGRILSLGNSQPVPGATVSLMSGTTVLNSVAAGSDGQFVISSDGVPDSLQVSSVGFNPRRFSLAEYQEYYIFYLEPKTTELPEVVITTTKKNNTALWLGLAVLLLLTIKKRR